MYLCCMHDRLHVTYANQSQKGMRSGSSMFHNALVILMFAGGYRCMDDLKMDRCRPEVPTRFADVTGSDSHTPRLEGVGLVPGVPSRPTFPQVHCGGDPVWFLGWF